MSALPTDETYLAAMRANPPGSASKVSIDLVRRLPPDEAGQARAAIGFCRNHFQREAVGLMFSATELLRVAVERLTPNEPTFARRAGQVQAAALSWLLLWGMLREHQSTDLRRRFGETTFEAIEKVRNRTYDAHPGYRMAEGLRVYVAHLTMPPLRITGSENASGTTTSVTIDGARVLAWDSCPGNLKKDLRATPTPDLLPLVEDAMAALEEVLIEVFVLDVPQLQEESRRLLVLADEVPEGTLPVITTVPADLATKGGALQQDVFADVIALIRRSPLGNTTPSGQSG